MSERGGISFGPCQWAAKAVNTRIGTTSASPAPGGGAFVWSLGYKEAALLPPLCVMEGRQWQHEQHLWGNGSAVTRWQDLRPPYPCSTMRQEMQPMPLEIYLQLSCCHSALYSFG